MEFRRVLFRSHLERHMSSAGAELDQHDGARTAGRRRGSFPAGEKRTEVDQGDEPAAQRRQAAYCRELARNTEHFGGIADLQHPIDREAVRFSFGAHQQIALHSLEPPPPPPPLRASSAATPPPL